MIADILKYAEPVFKIKEKIMNIDQYLTLNDNLLYLIKATEDSVKNIFFNLFRDWKNQNL